MAFPGWAVPASYGVPGWVPPPHVPVTVPVPAFVSAYAPVAAPPQPIDWQQREKEERKERREKAKRRLPEITKDLQGMEADLAALDATVRQLCASAVAEKGLCDKPKFVVCLKNAVTKLQEALDDEANKKQVQRSLFEQIADE